MEHPFAKMIRCKVELMTVRKNTLFRRTAFVACPDQRLRSGVWHRTIVLEWIVSRYPKGHCNIASKNLVNVAKSKGINPGYPWNLRHLLKRSPHPWNIRLPQIHLLRHSYRPWNLRLQQGASSMLLGSLVLCFWRFHSISKRTSRLRTC